MCFSILSRGTTARNFDAYDHVRLHVLRHYPDAEFKPWNPCLGGRLSREIHVGGRYVMTITTRLSEDELHQAGVD